MSNGYLQTVHVQQQSIQAERKKKRMRVKKKKKKKIKIKKEKKKSPQCAYLDTGQIDALWALVYMCVWHLQQQSSSKPGQTEMPSM